MPNSMYLRFVQRVVEMIPQMRWWLTVKKVQDCFERFCQNGKLCNFDLNDL